MKIKSVQDLEVEKIVEINIQKEIVETEKKDLPEASHLKKENKIMQGNQNLIYPLMIDKKVLDSQNKLVNKTINMEEKITKINKTIIFNKATITAQ